MSGAQQTISEAAPGPVVEDKKSSPVHPAVWLFRKIGFGDAIDMWQSHHPHPLQRIKHTCKVGAKTALHKMPFFGLGDTLHTLSMRRSLGLRQTCIKIGKIIADQMAGRVVRSTLKWLLIPFLVGMIGGGTIMTMGMAALAMGTAAAVYTYSKEFLAERVKNKKTKEKTPVLSLSRFLKSLISFGGGAIGGSLGAWAIQTDAFQGAISSTKDFFMNDLGLSNSFNKHAPPIPDFVEERINNVIKPAGPAKPSF